MKPLFFATGVLLVCASACRPSVGPPISAIQGPAILAVVAEPAEVDPTTPNTIVSYEALAVDLNGRLPNADIPAPLLWATCTKPKPPVENNSVSAACLDKTQFPGSVGPTATTYVAQIPTDPCSLFGPKVPQPAPGEAPIRKRSPDVTGGYYVPIRTDISVPQGLARPNMSGPDSLDSFHMQRILCGLADASGEQIHAYNQTYKLNNNPRLLSLTVQTAGAPPISLPASRNPIPVAAAAGQSISFTASWTPESVESYPALDVIKRELVTHREAMRLSWYATGGSFEHDITGRTETESETYVENTWKPEAPGLVHMWIVLHDVRGGTDYAAYDIQVNP